MNKNRPSQSASEPNRRRFLGSTALGLGAVFGWLAPHTQADKPLQIAPGGQRALGKEFTYDVSSLQKTDPKLILADQVAAIKLPFKNPSCVAVHGPTLVTSGGQSLAYLDLEGNVKTSVTMPDGVRCVTAGPDQTVYAGLASQICTVDGSGKITSTRPVPGKRPIITSLAATEKDLFVGDAANRVVLRLNRQGDLVNQLGKKDPARNVPGLILPSPFLDMILGADGLLWVTNTGRHTVEAYTFEGELEYSWGEASNGIRGFCGCCNPVHLAQLPDGRFVTSEKGLPRIKLYSNRGEFLGVIAGAEQFGPYLENPQAKPLGLDIAVGADSRIYVADSLAGIIRVYALRAAKA
jgi:hypothetical protein